MPIPEKSSPPMDVSSLQGSEAAFVPDGGIPVICPQGACTMGSVCYWLLQIIDNVSNATRDSAISETYPQLDLVRVACYRLLQALGPPYDVSNADPLEENPVLATYPQVTLTAPQLRFVWDIYCQLLQVYGSFDESNATQLGGNQVLRDSAISQIYQVTEHVTFRRSNLLTVARRVALAATHVKFVLGRLLSVAATLWHATGRI
ncbi:hypothetical protein BJY52DRAFT_543664 [Lactarius psammicola]|nr:hypothetical protein BJY52DRAFT_543664 [Lactarius psammicola]